MTDTPPDWVLIEAAKRCEWYKDYPLKTLKISYGSNPLFVALCDMILKHEQPPVDRKMLCAREAMAGRYVSGVADIEGIAVLAIELWEEGFGK